MCINSPAKRSRDLGSGTKAPFQLLISHHPLPSEIFRDDKTHPHPRTTWTVSLRNNASAAVEEDEMLTDFCSGHLPIRLLCQVLNRRPSKHRNR